MARFFLSKDHIDGSRITITGEDAHHIGYSLRMAQGDKIIVCDMQKNEYHALITRITPQTVEAEIFERVAGETELPLCVTLYQGVPKGEKMDWIVQKTTELGVERIVPVETSRCIVKLDEKSRGKKQERWQKIVQEAAKQCQRCQIPIVCEPISFGAALKEIAEDSLHLFCYEGDDTKPLGQILPKDLSNYKNVSVWIGPEGGWAENEVVAAKEKNMILTGLGKRILRTETASLMVLSAIIYEAEKN